jgi:cell division protein FtsL
MTLRLIGRAIRAGAARNRQQSPGAQRSVADRGAADVKNQTLFIALLACAVLGSGVGVAYTQHTNRQLFIQLQKLQAERDDLEVEWELLKLEQSTLVTDAAVENVARTRLNMLAPDPGTVLYIAPP